MEIDEDGGESADEFDALEVKEREIVSKATDTLKFIVCERHKLGFGTKEISRWFRNRVPTSSDAAQGSIRTQIKNWVLTRTQPKTQLEPS